MNPTSKKRRLALSKQFPTPRGFHLLWKLLLLLGVMGGLASSTGAQTIPDTTTPVNPTATPNGNTRPDSLCSPVLGNRRILITGSNGLLPGLRQYIGEEAFVIKLLTIQPQPQTTTPAQSNGIVEATGWVVGPNGEVTLTAEPSRNLPPCP